MQQIGLTLWHRKDFLAQTPSVRQPLLETSDTNTSSAVCSRERSLSGTALQRLHANGVMQLQQVSYRKHFQQAFEASRCTSTNIISLKLCCSVRCYSPQKGQSLQIMKIRQKCGPSLGARAICANRFARIIRNCDPYFYSASSRFARITRISDSRESPDSRESCESIRANHATKGPIKSGFKLG